MTALEGPLAERGSSFSNRIVVFFVAVSQCRQVLRVLEKTYSVTNKAQYGFQKRISTIHAVLDIVTSAFENINRKFYTGLTFLDIKKHLTL